MSSISAQGVVERASAELSKRINGLGLRSSKHHHGHGGKTSVMERVTNALCGGSSHNNASIGAPEKPSRVAGSGKQSSGKNSSSSQQGTPQQNRKTHSSLPLGSGGGGGGGGAGGGSGSGGMVNILYQPPAQTLTADELMMDELFLLEFFQYFSPIERKNLAQVCTHWRDILYRNPKFWLGLLPVMPCRELRLLCNQERLRMYSSMVRRGFRAVCLLGATDEDAMDIVHLFPVASKNIHSLSLRCSSVSDRGLETLLDHLQVIYLFLLCIQLYIFEVHFIIHVHVEFIVISLESR